MSKRKCEVFRNVRHEIPKTEAKPWTRSEYRKESIGVGNFVGYGLDCDESEGGIASFTSAIVEMPDGTVENVSTSMINFVVDKPKDI